MASSQRVINTLGYAGLIPFVFPALLIIVGYEYSQFLTSLVGSYAFGIICFLAGSWWGMGLLPEMTCSNVQTDAHQSSLLDGTF